ncbi:hypothetical protein D3C87_1902090 [compost metagenome]
MRAGPDPVHFLGVVAVAGIFNAKQIAIGRECEAECVAHAAHVYVRRKRSRVVWKLQVFSIGGYFENAGG